MSDIIHLLPDSVANQIAAGEVIQRPASVVKELVENAIDAEATNIDVLITDSGKTCIQVIDNGTGMSETDARLAFERHSTSKIREATDLFTLRTMGFRGEALASIAAVAQVELKTHLRTDDLGTRVVIEGSKVDTQELVSCAQGSNFSVRNLFFNVPARRKFLKSNATELSNILIEFERIALVNPDVAFTLYHNNAELIKLSASNTRQRIVSVFGKKLNQQLLSVKVDTTLVKVSGFVTTPETARKKGAHQFFFVNGRYMRHPYFHKAVMSAYEHLIPVGEQVSYFIYFEVDPSNIDVNIHPTKTEIKFENEQAIWQILTAVVKEALGKFSAVPLIDFEHADALEIPVYNPNAVSNPPKINLSAGYNPFKTHTGGQYTSQHPDIPWENLYQGTGTAAIHSPNGSPETVSPRVDTQEATGVGESFFPGVDNGPTRPGQGSQYTQFKGRFIVTAVKSGMLFIDQHRAHVRILFDRYMDQLKHKDNTSQGMLFPEIVQLSATECAVLQNITDELASIGFDINDLGGGNYAINGIPAGIEGLDPVRLLQNMIYNAMEKGCQVKEELQHSLALTLAQAAAIVYGQVLGDSEMVSLVDNLFACGTPKYTPDGKVILATIREEDIENLFK